MNIKNSKLIHGILALFYCLFGNAAEQDNWYIANEWTVNDPQGIVYYEDNNTGVKQIYVCEGSAVQKNWRLRIKWFIGSGHHHSK